MLVGWTSLNWLCPGSLFWNQSKSHLSVGVAYPIDAFAFHVLEDRLFKIVANMNVDDTCDDLSEAPTGFSMWGNITISTAAAAHALRPDGLASPIAV